MGYGSIGKRHHNVLKDLLPDSNFHIYDPALGINEELDIYQSYDLGVICTPTFAHLTNAISIAENCKLLFIEKPLHTDINEILLWNYVLNNKELHVGCNIRYTDAVKKFKEVVNDAKIIRVTSMSNLLTWRKDDDKKSYSFNKKMGGGVLFDFVHEPDYISYCLGLPDKVSKYETRLFDSTIDSNDTCLMNWKYKDKLVSFCLSYCSKDYIRKIEVIDSSMCSSIIEFTKQDIEESYKKQWNDILSFGPRNGYNDCLKLYNLLSKET